MLEGLRLEGKHPLAVWSILKPREAFAVGALPESGKAQDCVTVNYVLAGAVLGEGLWSLEVPDHALGRCIERSGLLPGAIISEAHHNLLRLRAETVAPGGVFDDRRFLVKAGSGGFVCSLWAGQNVSLGGECSISVHADTWLAGDMLHADQILLADDGEPGARLGDGWFVPAPLRRIADEGNGLLRLSLWGPALPELLAKPQGRA
jgi:hypothetical protein